MVMSSRTNPCETACGDPVVRLASKLNAPNGVNAYRDRGRSAATGFPAGRVEFAESPTWAGRQGGGGRKTTLKCSQLLVRRISISKDRCSVQTCARQSDDRTRYVTWCARYVRRSFARKGRLKQPRGTLRTGCPPMAVPFVRH